MLITSLLNMRFGATLKCYELKIQGRIHKAMWFLVYHLILRKFELVRNRAGTRSFVDPETKVQLQSDPQ